MTRFVRDAANRSISVSASFAGLFCNMRSSRFGPPWPKRPIFRSFLGNTNCPFAGLLRRHGVHEVQHVAGGGVDDLTEYGIELTEEE